jgi:hypothetical protein
MNLSVDNASHEAIRLSPNHEYAIIQGDNNRVSIGKIDPNSRKI